MNKRIRQWMKAEENMDKYDPPMIATIRDNPKNSYSRIVMFRQSEREKVIEKYGPKLDIWSSR